MLHICNIQLTNRMKNIEKKTYPIIEEAYNEYYLIMLQYVICRLKCKHEAEDLVQNVFVRLLEYDNMLQKSTIRSFLFTVARNLMTDYLRRYYRNSKMVSYIYENITECDNGSEEEMVVKDLLFMEQNKLSAFPRQRQRIYFMSRFEEKTLCEISEELQLSKRTVENHLLTGRKIMRDYIRMCI